MSPSNLSAASKAPSSPGESHFSRAVFVFFHRACVGTRQFRVNTLNWTSRTCDLYFFWRGSLQVFGDESDTFRGNKKKT